MRLSAFREGRASVRVQERPAASSLSGANISIACKKLILIRTALEE
jgi:hypothetical protein